MKLLKKVSAVEVKRCFVMTYYMRKFGIAGKHDTKIPTREKYLTALKKSKNAVNNLNEKQLDKILSEHRQKRLVLYNAVSWHVGEVSTKEVGVWTGAGGLPLSWTNGTLFATAEKVKTGLDKNSKKIRKRAKRAIPAIIVLKDIIKKEKYMFPIVFEGGISAKRRTGPLKESASIDDGNMRAIAFVISGDKKFKAYVGVRL